MNSTCQNSAQPAGHAPNPAAWMFLLFNINFLFLFFFYLLNNFYFLFLFYFIFFSIKQPLFLFCFFSYLLLSLPLFFLSQSNIAFSDCSHEFRCTKLKSLLVNNLMLNLLFQIWICGNYIYFLIICGVKKMVKLIISFHFIFRKYSWMHADTYKYHNIS